MYNYNFVERFCDINLDIIKRLILNEKINISFHDYKTEFEKLYPFKTIDSNQLEELVVELTRSIKYIYKTTGINSVIKIKEGKITIERKDKVNFKLILQYILLLLF